MREQKRKNGVAVTDNLIKGWPDDIVADVLEAWIAISRLMAKMGESENQLEADRAAKRPPPKSLP